MKVLNLVRGGFAAALLLALVSALPGAAHAANLEWPAAVNTINSNNLLETVGMASPVEKTLFWGNT